VNSGGVEQAMLAFSQVSQSLLESYETLARRAEYVEEELGRTNRELEERVAELDTVKRHLEAILESLPSGVIVRDDSGCITRVNEAAARLLGRPESELEGERVVEGLRGPLEDDDRAATWEERELRRTDGSRVVIAARCSSVVTRSGEPLGSVEIVDDRTELTRIAERMHQQSKMAALGTMAGGIAHEIRNPLNAIRGFAALLRRELTGKGKCGRWSERIVDGVGEVDSIITSMLTFAEPESLRMEAFSLRALAEESVALVVSNAPAPGFAHDIEIHGRDLELRADRIKLRQALRNLVVNAIDAQPGVGSVRIDLARDQDEVVLRVSDAGPGLDPELARKVTEPFFTTRAEGTGLGLALVHSIARLHGGRLEIAPEPSALGGAEFRIRLPFVSPD
jgi:PAS domain S-box-containing protein